MEPKGSVRGLLGFQAPRLRPIRFAGDAGSGLEIIESLGSQRQQGRCTGWATSYLAAQMLQVREVPFAFLTGSEGDEIESRYAKIPVLRKPFSEMEIESCLRRLIWNGS